MGFLRDVKSVGWGMAIHSLVSFNKFSLLIKRLVICNRVGHDDLGYGECFVCFADLRD